MPRERRLRGRCWADCTAQVRVSAYCSAFGQNRVCQEPSHSVACFFFPYHDATENELQQERSLTGDVLRAGTG